ncbi:UDP-glucose dehydrogenase family protein [Paenibacillus sp. 7523-1]|uniref:UDP-glucose dehydrogenase family protein n=1 Tax=Paenibacillus sp. 7523-1 TaxID=2022550 RepID=UPI000BA7B23C|nr:UDP-glucose/GDP-mannose dehydrogenase family protein [Paenibacillus sp. 7523-1]PAD30656.1 UDP-glucose 6-dehydrogenase [Paenibacillus sp. 7523-1]
MNIVIIGTGYVGLVSGVCYAEMGHNVVCVDHDANKIDSLNLGESTIFEPGLNEMMSRNVRSGRLSFSTKTIESVRNAEIVFIAVGTPPLPSGQANLNYVFKAAENIGESLSKYTIVAVKSTVPVGSNDVVEQIISSKFSGDFCVVSLPEFLREGSAIEDTFHPDRIIIGIDNNDERTKEQLKNFYAPLNVPMVFTDRKSSEMIKYASNAFLATKISFINEIANICEKLGANVEEVAYGMGLDNRIGMSFLKAGIGYGGSCFPKDTEALIQIAGNVEHEFKLLRSVVEVNQYQRMKILTKLKNSLGSLEGKEIGIWGLSFKPGTDDIRETPAIEIIDRILDHGGLVKVYDPIAMDNFKKVMDRPNIKWCSSSLRASENCDALCVITEWPEFKYIDLMKLKSIMRRPIIIDGRNIYSDHEIKEAGFDYFPVGKKASRTSGDIFHIQGGEI